MLHVSGFMFQANKGFGFIDVLVGTALMLIIFTGIYGAYQLGFKVIMQSKARITATALANQRMEMVRNLPYDDVGTIGGIPSGTIPETENITRNDIDYTIKTTVVYIDDPFDGTAPDDPLPSDYKRVRVKVFWGGKFSGEVVLLTDVAPKGVETTEGGGTLSISVFDASGIGVPQADVHVVNNNVEPVIDANYQTDDNGNLILAGAPTSTESYQITTTKAGYSTDRTYGVEEVANPIKPHASVYEGQLTEISFAIDRVSSFGVDTVSSGGADSFADSFLDQSKISEWSDIVVSGGEVTLATTSEGYLDSGYLISIPISPENLTYWDEFSWTDSEPQNTEIRYQVLYFDGQNWILIPDTDLPGNSSGFGTSPVDLENLATTTYSQIELRGNLSTTDASTTPVLFDWQVSWRTNEPTPIPNVAFTLEGAKIIGTDEQDTPVLKYSQEHTTDSNGHIDILNLEWDSYSFYVDRETTGLDLIETQPPQPVDLLPNTSQSVTLVLESENSLLVTVKDANTLEPIFAASVRVYNIDLGYDNIRPTDENGQAFFIPLEQSSYDLEVQMDGYQTYTGTVSVSGDTTETIVLTPL